MKTKAVAAKSEEFHIYLGDSLWTKVLYEGMAEVIVNRLRADRWANNKPIRIEKVPA